MYIVNLQWTPKDSIASIKINGKCDEVMKIVMKHLNIDVPSYDRSKDPIFYHASLLKEEELHTTSQPMLQRFIFKGEESSEMDESNTGTYSSEKQTVFTESEDSKSQNDSIRNFSCIKLRHRDVSSEGVKSMTETDSSEVVVKKEEACDRVEVKLETNKVQIAEVLDLTADDDSNEAIAVKVEGKRDDVIDFEELIDNLDTSPKKEEPADAVKAKPKLEPVAVVKPPEEPKVSPQSFILQNQSLIDMAMLNNSLITASLAFAPVSSTSREALTATALILNYNNQIINTLTNNLNLLPYSNAENGTANVLLQSKPSCDKNGSLKQEILENDIEMVESSDDGLEAQKVEKKVSSAASAEQYYKQLIASYCMAINDNLPKWSDVNYAYSGLHTIVSIPPEDANLWKNGDEEVQQKKKLRSSTASERKAAKSECKFCYDLYDQMECQFYKPVNREFRVSTYRNGKLIVCECCDYTEDEEEEQTEDDNSKLNGNEKEAKLSCDDKEKPGVVIRAGWFGKGNSNYSATRLTLISCLLFQDTARFRRNVRNNHHNCQHVFSSSHQKRGEVVQFLLCNYYMRKFNFDFLCSGIN